jgi:hypothetical protein
MNLRLYSTARGPRRRLAWRDPDPWIPQAPTEERARGYGVSTILPTTSPASIFWCASTAASSGSTSCTTASISPRLAAPNCLLYTALRSVLYRLQAVRPYRLGVRRRDPVVPPKYSMTGLLHR